jgi:hypothetical protein
MTPLFASSLAVPFRRTWFLLTAGVLSVSLLAGSARGESLIESASSLLASIQEVDSEKASIPFDSAVRTDWHFVPKERAGVRIGDMPEPTVEALFDFVGLVLSEQGIDQVKGVLLLEQVLLDLEGSATRNPGSYYFIFWGSPAEDQAWGWRFEGHHLSLNVTYQGTQLESVTPCFLGANPAKVLSGEYEGFRNLPGREDKAFEFIESLGKEERLAALQPEEPSDVIGAGQKTLEPNLGKGLKVSELSETQKALFRDLLDCYLESFDSSVPQRLERTVDKLLADPDLVFQWRGGFLPEERHCYRICGHGVDIQFANEQKGVNHVHTLVFFPGQDYGGTD